jgi:hypothetical protein
MARTGCFEGLFPGRHTVNGPSIRAHLRFSCSAEGYAALIVMGGRPRPTQIVSTIYSGPETAACLRRT